MQENDDQLLKDPERDVARALRKETEKKLEKRELSLYYRGLAMGLILGVVGNLFVHFLMNALDILEIPAYDWVLVTTGAFAITLTLIWLFDRESKKLLKEST